MFERDYLVRMLFELVEAIRRSMARANSDHQPRLAAESLERAMGEAVELEPSVFLNLAPESMASIISITGTHEKLASLLVRSLWLASRYYEEDGRNDLAQLRLAQAEALADAYGDETPESFGDEELEALALSFRTDME